MNDIKVIAEVVSQIGFPALVAFYLLMRFDKKMDKLISILERRTNIL